MMILCPKKHCPYCLDITVKRNGHYANARQRWFCCSCKRSFCWTNSHNKFKKERAWFEQWIIEGYSVRQLCSHSGHSSAKLYRIINYWLSHPPVLDDSPLDNLSYLIFDGTFLHRPNSIVVLMDGITNTVITGTHGIRENSVPQLSAFFVPLKERSLSPLSCTVDGNPQVIKVLKQLWPDIIIQRCLVHIQRQGLMWCRRFPKRTDAKHLRDIFLQATNIYTKRDRDLFLENVAYWEDRYGQHIATQLERGRVFSDIKRARSMLMNALSNMFHYLDNPQISATTNGLEGYFSRLKTHYPQHRGLHPSKRTNYFAWYFHLRPR